ncbi:MAG: peptidoglycan-binding protein LysM [Acidobacteriota bacterium]
MGLIDFVVNAGKKLLGKDDQPEPQPTQTGPLPNPRLASSIEKFIGDLSLDVEDLRVDVVGDVATVRGSTPSQETREKIVLAVGNVEGVARVDDRLEVEAPEPEAVFYTVKRGDTLSAIAREHYGNAGKYPVIFEANKPMLSDPDKIYPGQVLRIPPIDG